MTRDTSPTDTILRLRQAVIDADALAKVKALRRQRGDANSDVVRAAHAANNLAGLQGTAEDLEAARSRERAVLGELQRTGARVFDAADAAVSDFAAIAQELSAVAGELASLMRDIGEHVSACAGRHHPAFEQWAMADASSRGLNALAEQLGPPAPQRRAVLRWSVGWEPHATLKWGHGAL